ncbi:hypothetical protein OPQ81_006411 [Rhizoctonia solani]|nr:hypothetical protein OPQ81_006411 [Rhizoctonia solani]
MNVRSDRREISALQHASSGQGDPPRDSSKKRSREDDTNSNGSGRRFLGGPFSGVAHDNLRGHRTKGGRTLKRNNSPKVTPKDNLSDTNSAYAPLGHAVFPRTGTLDDTDPASDYLSVRNPPRHSPSAQLSPHGLSMDTNARMDGKAGDDDAKSLSLADVFSFAELPPDTPERKNKELRATESAASSGLRSSSDPINLIESDDDTSHPTKGKDDDIVEFGSQPTSQPPRTPRGKTQFSAGRVKNQVEKLEAVPTTPTPTSRNQSTLMPFLQQLPTSQTASSSRATTKPASTSKGPSGTGIIIRPGMTRTSQPGISKRMQGKPKPSTGLKLQSQGHSPPSIVKSGPRPKSQNPKSSATTYKLELQEWYCGAKHHESNKSKYSYELTFDGNKLVITSSEEKQVRRTTCLMKGDVDSFEVVDTAEEAVYPWLILSINPKVLATHNWQNHGLGDSHRILLHFKPDCDGIHDNWKGFIQSMANWAQKEIIKKHSMDGLVGSVTDRSLHHRPTKPKTQSEFIVPKIQGSNNPSHQRDLVREPKAPAKSTYLKPRTRSSVSNSNQEDQEQDSKPIVIQDLDEVVLVHPTGTGSVTINRGELARLEPGEFLNDTLIELGLKMWLNDLRSQDPALVDQIHIFSSFFFKKLDAGRGKGCDYNSVKKWTSKFDLFSKKFIIIPINEHLHWYLAIICFPEHVLKAPIPQPPAQPTRVTRSSDGATKAEQRMSSESDIANLDQMTPITTEAGSPTEQGKMDIDADLAGQSERMAIDSPPEPRLDVVNADPKPNDSPIVDITNDDSEDRSSSRDISTTRPEKTWILILDSLGGKHPRTVRILREYLQAEAYERHGKVVDIKDTRSSGGLVEDKHLSVPVQPNWCDCGVYLLHYVEAFYDNPLEIIALPPGAKRKPKEAGNRYDELWRTDQVKNKRAAFREKLHELSAKNTPVK